MIPELWLTEIRMNPRNHAASRDLRSVTQLHRTVMSLFPDTESDQARKTHGVLHRLDSTTSGPVLLVQSAAQPDSTSLEDGYGQTRTTSLHTLLGRLSPGLPVRYRILVNATKRIGTGERKGKRVALGAHDTRAWWTSRAEAGGLTLDADFTIVSETLVGREGDDGRITLRPWRIEGTATVLYPGALSAAIADGIGKGRAYGCGMLSIAPLPTTR